MHLLYASECESYKSSQQAVDAPSHRASRTLSAPRAMGRADRASQLVATAGCILAAQPVWSFFVPSKVAFNSGGTSLLQQTQTTTCATHKGGVGVNLGYFCRRENYHAKAKARSRMTRGSVTMERPTGRFQTLAKPKFDPENPNAVLGEIQVPGLEQAMLSERTSSQRLLSS